MIIAALFLLLALLPLPAVAACPAGNTGPCEGFAAFVGGLSAAGAPTGSDRTPYVQGGSTKYLPPAAEVSAAQFGVSAASSDNLAAMTAAFAYAATAKVIIPCGTFKVSAPVPITINNAWIQGSSSVGTGGGTGCTTIESTSGTADLIDISPGVTAYYLGWLNLDRTVTATGGSGLSVGAGSAGTIDHVQAIDQFTGFSLGATNLSFCNYCVAMNNFSDGFSITNTTPIPQMQWVLSHTLSQFNNGHGYDANAIGVALGPSFDYAGSFENHAGGFWFTGTGSANDVEMSNIIGASDGNNEIYFSNPGNNNTITNPFLERAGLDINGRNSGTGATNTGSGILMDTAGLSTGIMNINGGLVQNNSQGGVVVGVTSTLGTLMINGLTATDNGSASNSAGFFLQSTATVWLTGVTSGNILGGGHQLYGLDMANASDVWVPSANLVGNATAGCNVTLTVAQKGVVNGSGC